MGYRRRQDDPAIEIDTGMGPLFPILLALVLLSAAGYVVGRAVLAHRRGEDPRLAAARAARAVGPPLVVAVFAIVGLAVLAGLMTILFLVALLSALSGDDSLDNLALALLIVSGLLLIGLLASVVWAVRRMVVKARRQGG